MDVRDECDNAVASTYLDCRMFPGYSKDSRKILLSLLTFLNNMHIHLKPALISLSSVCIVVSMFHFIVLSHKSMRTSSANIILLGIVICDILSMVSIIYGVVWVITLDGFLCTQPTPIHVIFINRALDTILSTFRRVSTWLGVLLALIRYLAIRFFMFSERFTRPRTGVLSILGSLLVSSFFSVYSWENVTYVQNGTWIADEDCPLPHQEPAPMYFRINKGHVFGSDELKILSYTFWNGMCSKIIPALLLLIFSILLLVELAKTKSTRSYSSTGEGTRKDRTNTLIMLITLTFVFAEVPMGCFNAAGTFFLKDDKDRPYGVEAILVLTTVYWNLVYVLSTALHCLICFGLSVQYREVAGSLFRNPFRKRENHVRDASFSGPRSSSFQSRETSNYRSRNTGE